MRIHASSVLDISRPLTEPLLVSERCGYAVLRFEHSSQRIHVLLWREGWLIDRNGSTGCTENRTVPRFTRRMLSA